MISHVFLELMKRYNLNYVKKSSDLKQDRVSQNVDDYDALLFGDMKDVFPGLKVFFTLHTKICKAISSSISSV